LGDASAANKHYRLAASFTQYLPEDGYGKMIRSGIDKALKRIQEKRSDGFEPPDLVSNKKVGACKPT
jgi:hypothetical protein